VAPPVGALVGVPVGANVGVSVTVSVGASVTSGSCGTSAGSLIIAEGAPVMSGNSDSDSDGADVLVGIFMVGAAPALITITGYPGVGLGVGPFVGTCGTSAGSLIVVEGAPVMSGASASDSDGADVLVGIFIVGTAAALITITGYPGVGLGVGPFVGTTVGSPVSRTGIIVSVGSPVSKTRGLVASVGSPVIRTGKSVAVGSPVSRTGMYVSVSPVLPATDGAAVGADGADDDVGTGDTVGVIVMTLCLIGMNSPYFLYLPAVPPLAPALTILSPKSLR